MTDAELQFFINANRQALQSTDEKTKQFEKFKQDYTVLKKRLSELPSKLTYDVMVPLCSVGFMKGKLQHCNEIMILLGDNWFVQRSAAQAVELIDRRLQRMDDMISDLNKQSKLLHDRIDSCFNEASEDVVEIKEEFKEEEFEEWMRQHKISVRNEHLREAETNASSNIDLDSIFAKFQLPDVGGSGSSIENSIDRNSTALEQPVTSILKTSQDKSQKNLRENVEKHVRFDDDASTEAEASSEDSDDLDNKAVAHISFSHTGGFSETCSNCDTNTTFCCPAGAVRHVLIQMSHTSEHSIPMLAFDPTCKVVEHAENTDKPSTSSALSKMSKFRASRLANKTV